MVDDSWVEDLWGGRDFGFSQLAANGSSGGILLIWDTRSFTYNEGLGYERFVAIKGEWKGKIREVCLACIYGPHVGRQKASLWNRLLGVMNDANGPWCIFGNLNIVRGDEERMNSQVNLKEANDFTNEAKLVEIPMRGRKFTRLKEGDIILVVEEEWKMEVRSMRPECRFRDNVKVALKKWSKERGKGWMMARKSWMDKENKYRCMLRQKARIRLRSEDPKLIKAKLVRHYKTLFTERDSMRPIFYHQRVEKILVDHATLLEKEFNEEEILDAVRGCGG
ncbi:RNA-directed DNA polymerase, eukaryota [Tanacetum coccineum]